MNALHQQRSNSNGNERRRRRRRGRRPAPLSLAIRPKNAPPEHGNDPALLARAFLNAYGRDGTGCLTLRHWAGKWWKDGDGVYREMSDEELEALLTRFVKTKFDSDGVTDTKDRVCKVTPNLIHSVTLFIRAETGVLLTHVQQPPAWTDGGDGRRYISLLNGCVALDEVMTGAVQTVYRHTPRWFTTVQLPYAYDPNATCPTWEHFLATMFAGDQERIEFVREWFAYCLTGDTSQQQFLIAVGSGANGKKVLLETLQRLVGEENCSSVALEDFKGDFHLSATIGKSLNVVTEIGDVQRLPEGKLKAFVAADRMSFNRKHRDPIEVYPTARLVFAANDVPRFTDKSEGIWRRLIILPCDVTIPVEKQDRTLPLKMREELPGIFNWAMRGAAALQKRGYFAVPSSAQQAGAAHRLQSNPARRFLHEYCEVDPQGSVGTERLFGVYQEWCQGMRLPWLDDGQFGKEVAAAFPDITKGRPTISGRRLSTYFGIRLARVPYRDVVDLEDHFPDGEVQKK